MMNHKPDTKISEEQLNKLRVQFGDKFQENLPLGPYTTVGIGGPADGILIAHDAQELSIFARTLWQFEIPFRILGNGSNVLISDKGIRSIIIINKANNMKLVLQDEQPQIQAESGTLLNHLSNFAADHNLTGLEWAEGIPGTVGGAIVGNAGAFGFDLSGQFIMANILQPQVGETIFLLDDMAYSYRSSCLKESTSPFVVLSGTFRVKRGHAAEIEKKMKDFSERRRSRQPKAKSLGSIFRNPAADYAGRLITQTGLKGTRIGDAMISNKHANIFINVGKATAMDFYRLIELTQRSVLERFGIELIPEIQMLGDWDL
ncbi:MAG: UDP-N-acetylmuramate dehydrogenase [Anaerolineaceae bacterium]|nr:UDP-N-acetylmuramate dehydrogenase [Anaerolineaceae bacterium]